MVQQATGRRFDVRNSPENTLDESSLQVTVSPNLIPTQSDRLLSQLLVFVADYRPIVALNHRAGRGELRLVNVLLFFHDLHLQDITGGFGYDSDGSRASNGLNSAL